MFDFGAEFWVGIAFLIFWGILFYYGGPGRVLGSLDNRGRRIADELAEAKRLRTEAEALLKQKPKLAAERYLQKSDALGVDQRILRLRYGQFLGEEAEDGPALPTADAGGHEADTGDHAGHDYPAHAPATTFGQDVDLLVA